MGKRYLKSVTKLFKFYLCVPRSTHNTRINLGSNSIQSLSIRWRRGFKISNKKKTYFTGVTDSMK